MDPLSILLKLLVDFIVARAAEGFPIISKWLEDLFNKTKPTLKATITGATPKELTTNLVAALNKQAKQSTFLHKRYFKFLGRVAPKFSDEMWDKFIPKNSTATADSFEPQDRILFDDKEVANALNEVLSSK